MVCLLLYATGQEIKQALDLLLVDLRMKRITISFNETAKRDVRIKLSEL